MLMENRIEDSHGAVDAKESRSLDLQTLNDQNPGPSERKKRKKVGSLKRMHATIDGGTGQVKKKSKKELPQNGVAPTKRSKKSLDGVSNGGSSSTSGGSNKVENGPIEKPDDKSNGFGGTSFNQGTGIAQIPKRRRAVRRRKKAHVINGLKLEETLSGKFSSSDVAAELNGGSKGSTDPNGGLNGQPDEDGNPKDGITGAENKAEQRKSSDDKKENILSKLNLLQLSEKELANSLPFFGDLSSNVKAKRIRKRKKEAGIETNASAKGTKPNLSTGLRDNSVDDDEDNLEANAARMLSSRFDPGCTGFSSNGKHSDSVMIPSLGNNARDESNLQSESDAASDDADGRALRPRNQHRRKAPSRKRRHFYEVLAKDADAHWMVQREIKVYWPLDQFWYFGKVMGYDSETMLHHIKYDDCEEEWIDLQNERIKLLLYPSELPSVSGRRASRGRRRVKEKPAAVVQDDCVTNSQKDSEPIISWLERPSTQAKFPSSGITKTNKLGKAHPPDPSLSKSMHVETLSSTADILDGNTAMPNDSLGMEAGGTSHAEIKGKSPRVYFRRRFRGKKHGDSDVSDRGFAIFREDQYVCGAAYDSADSQSVLPMRSNPTEQFDGHLVHVSLPRSDDHVLILSLSVPVLNTGIYSFKLNLCPFMAPYYSFGVEILRLSHATLMLQHGTLMTLWPSIHLEMLFVDNLAGLRFLLFEGGLVQAIALVFSVLDVFHQSNSQRNHVDGQVPVTSVRFQFSFSGNVKKQLAFALCDFHGLETSRWASLDRVFQKICSLVKLLPPSECTYDNIKALENGHDQSNLPSESQELTSRLVLQRRTRRPMIGSFASVIQNQSWVDRDDRWARIPPFAFSSSAAPTFFASLHLNLLTGCSISHNIKDHNSVSLPGGEEQIDCCPDMVENGASAGCGDAEMLSQPSQNSQIVGDDCLNKGQGDSLVLPSSSKELCPSLEGKTGFQPISGTTVELPLDQPQQRPSPARVRNRRASKRLLESMETAISSPSCSGPKKSRRSKKIGMSSMTESLSKAVESVKPDLLRTGPRKPRTQVSYSLPLEVDDATTKSRTYQTKGFSHKRIRRASRKKEPDTDRSVELETLSCDVNVLVIMGVKGLREKGAKVVLELVDDNEWRLAVKISESTRYFYKASRFLLSGSTNRFTHAMMWKGGKDWILEFHDRSHWALFKEMHEECYTRNVRAASLKDIPIPGVHLVEENDDNRVEVPFVRPSPKYYQQSQTDVEIAMDPLHVMYDMDSDDELWISKLKSSDVENPVSRRITDDLFEKIMDTLEKVSYANQQDQFTPADLEELSVIDSGSVEVIRIVYEHWVEKRKKKGMPLIRHLQPPLWEVYQEKLQQWESTMPNNNGKASSRGREKAKKPEKPPMFAFCLKPRGLELLNHRGMKHRSHKKLHANGHSGRRFNGSASGDEKMLHRQGSSSDSSRMFQAPTRLRSPRNAGGSGYIPSSNKAPESSHNPRNHQNKSKKIDTSLPRKDLQPNSAPNQRFMGWGSGMQAHDLAPPEWRSYKFRELDPAKLDNRTLHDAIKAAKHTVSVAELKREKADKLLYKADLAIQRASSAMMLADAIKASSADSTKGASSDNSSI